MSEEETKNTRTQKKISCWHVFAHVAGVLSLALSVVLVCLLFPRQNIPAFDYQAILVGILAGLFTLIVGWNIYQMVDWRNEFQKVSEIKAEIESKILELQKDVDINSNKTQNEIDKIKKDHNIHTYLDYFALSDVYASLAGGKLVSNVDYECIKYRIEAIYYASIIEEWEQCRSIAKLTTSFIKRKRPKLTKLETKEFIEVLMSIEGKDIADELSNLIVEIKTENV